MIQQATDAVVIQISPVMFFVGLGVILVGGIVAALRFTNWMTAWMTRIEALVGDIPGLKADRHAIKERALILEARADAVDKWIDDQKQEERNLRSAMAEFMQDRRKHERRDHIAEGA